MKNHPIAAALWLLTLAYPAVADTFHMKDGTIKKGTILREENGSYVVNVQITKTIKDEQIIAKSDIADIEPEKPDITAFETIEKLTPTPDLLTSEEYTLRIRKVEKFLSSYKNTPKTSAAQAILATLKKEEDEIRAGGIKMKGKIIPPADYKANAYDIDAFIQAEKIRTLVKSAQYLKALHTYKLFSTDFSNTTEHASLVPLINLVINFHMKETEQSLATYDCRVKERQTGLERMTDTDRRVTEEAIQEETADLEKQFKAEKDAKRGWVTPHPYYKPSLEETLAYGKLELTRLAALGSEKPVDGGKAYRDAFALIQEGKTAEITAAIAAAKTAKLPQRYITNLEVAAKVITPTP